MYIKHCELSSILQIRIYLCKTIKNLHAPILRYGRITWKLQNAIAHGLPENEKIFFRCFTFCAICTISVRVGWSSINAHSTIMVADEWYNIDGSLSYVFNEEREIFE